MSTLSIEHPIQIQEHLNPKQPHDPCSGTTGILVRSEPGKDTYRCLTCNKEGVIPATLPSSRRPRSY